MCGYTINVTEKAVYLHNKMLCPDAIICRGVNKM
jgi:hypothetical protein